MGTIALSGTLDRVRTGITAAGRCQELLALDDVWTSYLDDRMSKRR